MHNKLIPLIIIIGLFWTMALAGEQKVSVLSDWLTVVQQKVNTIVPRKTLPRRNSDTGMRLDREAAFVNLYWKGKKTGEEPVTKEEMTQFKAALEPAVRGERETAITALERFLEQYPESALVPDAKKTLDLVKSEAAKEEQAAGKEENKEQ
jgi:hypothetical protein